MALSYTKKQRMLKEDFEEIRRQLKTGEMKPELVEPILELTAKDYSLEKDEVFKGFEKFERGLSY